MIRIPSTTGVSLAAYDFGGNGPPLLLSHATGFHSQVWRPVVDSLKQFFHCWGYDTRGHGNSSTPTAAIEFSPPEVPQYDLWDWHHFAEDTHAVIAYLELHHPFGVGHSSGGASLLLAEEMTPGTFSNLFCYEPVIFPGVPAQSPAIDRPLVQRTLSRRSQFVSREEAIRSYAEKTPMNRFAPEVLVLYVEHGFNKQPDESIALKLKPTDEAAIYAMGLCHDAYVGLHKVQCPVTLACGRDSTELGLPVMRQVADALTHSEVVLFDGLDHFGPMENPDTVSNAALTAFGR